MSPSTPPPTPARPSAPAVLGGVALAFGGVVLLAAGARHATWAGAWVFLAGPLLVASGVWAAGASTQGRNGAFGVTGAPIAALGIAIAARAQSAATDAVRLAADSPASRASEGMVFAAGLLASMVGLGLLFVYGLRLRH